MRFDEKMMNEGRRVLVSLLPELREEILSEGEDLGLQVQSGPGRSVLSRIREEHFDAYIVYRSARGWHADVLFKNLPAGVPNLLGTPDDDPLPSRELADQQGRLILKMLLKTAIANAAVVAPEEDFRAFDIHGATMQVPGSAVDQVRPFIESFPANVVGDVDSHRNRLSRLLTEAFGEDSFDLEKWESLHITTKHRIFTAIVILMAMGEFRHPRRPGLEAAGTASGTIH